ncbi:MAG: nucleotide exchange factor GrpE [Bacteroidales bacterium]|nr:nucleotide exchange factor GrpE [Parachlamydiales bacterium]MBN2755817.1 nucleotide exchange factor GrpE [Bacteroidales bacterium]
MAKKSKKEIVKDKKLKPNNKVEEINNSVENSVELDEKHQEQENNEINIEEQQIIESTENSEEQIKEAPSFEQKFSEINDKYLRLSAEFDNYRKRSLKEKMDLIKSAGEDILINILPVMDNFERALESIKENADANSTKEGIELIYSNFNEFLKQRGVQEIEAKGNSFDTDYHEAISKIPSTDEEQKGKVIDVIEKGYLLHGKVIRFAKVVVGE